MDELDQKICQLYADGYTAVSISKKLHLNKRTLESRMERLKKKMAAKTITHLIARLIRLGEIH
jgi:DNA-binding CsgD family transcriptional regulator